MDKVERNRPFLSMLIVMSCMFLEKKKFGPPPRKKTLTFMEEQQLKEMRDALLKRDR